MQTVEEEVRSQIEAAKEEMSQDFGPSQGDFQFEKMQPKMQPLDDLRFEFDSLKNQVEGTDPVSRFDGLEFEYARLESLNNLQCQVDDINNNLALRDLDAY